MMAIVKTRPVQSGRGWHNASQGIAVTSKALGNLYDTECIYSTSRDSETFAKWG